MPTNRRRTMRTSNRIPTTITPEYRGDLTARDFLGELTADEIEVAKELGIYKWDGLQKEFRAQDRRRSHAD